MKGIHAYLFSLLFFLSLGMVSQAQVKVEGTVFDENSQTLVGATVVVKGTSIGTTTDVNGRFEIEMPPELNELMFSYIGFLSETVVIDKTQGLEQTISVSLWPNLTTLEEFVVIGYGVQRKESVVGAITQVKGEELMRSGGVTTVGQALAGRLPGVTTIASTGRPGDESPNIYIRGRSSWSSRSQPLVLVDGIERPMNEVDNGDIESISVLKDASATAVFGVKGANGVILITTKRGKEGKAQLSVGVNSTSKFTGKLPRKLESFDGIMAMNEAIERTMPYESDGWSGWKDYVPMDIANKYRNPADEWESYVYPNVDWRDYMMKDFAMDHRVNLSVRGGTERAKYYGALTYSHVGDIFDGSGIDNGKGYSPDFRYDRFNYRTNIDFDLTASTRFSVNLSGMYGLQKSNDYANRRDKFIYGSLYVLAPSVFYPRYDDGLWGKHPQEVFDTQNPAMLMVSSGAWTNHRVQVNSDFVLDQKLDFVLKGLKFRGTLAHDNRFLGQRGIDDPLLSGNQGNVVVRMINPNDGSEIISDPGGKNQFDFVVVPWTLKPLQISSGATFRKLYYQLALNYDRRFADVHNLSVLALMSREEYGQGSVMKTYREDWVGRLTYDYASRYFLDVNGAYNGSEKFGPGYRFELFPSVALGWMISNENFMANTYAWLDNLKIRGSYGLVGDDEVGERWAYVDQWGVGGRVYMDPGRGWRGLSPYEMYRERLVGNPNIRWESAIKSNVGLEISLFKRFLSISADYFNEYRKDILVYGRDRILPAFIGIAAADANLGEAKVNGFEITAEINYQVNSSLTLMASGFYTMAKDEILFKEEPKLRDAYLNDKGGAIGQPRVQLPNTIMTSWDDVYMSPRQEGGLNATRPGYYSVIDFNGDGIIDNKDFVPYGFPFRPKNTWNATIGAEYKKWSFMVQFFGAYNAFKEFNTATFRAGTPLFFEHMTDYWTVDNPNNTNTLPSWKGQGATDPLRDWYDASYVKIQNIELSYNFNTLGTSYKVFVNGNDLFTWSHLPDQRQEDKDSWGNYPMFRRVNIGLNVNF
jgi:TonB-linked SusC/RagA family outer membrane protein